ncbi:hypothetical protein N0V90_000276 [Kalmusia sp. IMI 367209]|nr:hypothetical protein N0V90_000276 [Kalmusia sp. IMI 367209]
MSAITPFSIAISDNKIELLKEKLSLTAIPDEQANGIDSWARGVPLGDIKRLTHHWAEGYDWRAAEVELNKLPQFITEIEVETFGKYGIHFVHQKSNVEHAIPLLFIHGWPGGFFEVSKLLPYLKGDDEHPAFHVVAPSLVDFGFSSASKKAIHTNSALPAEPTESEHPQLHAKLRDTSLSAAELKGLTRSAEFWANGFGYYQLASTRPMTVGYALADSPVALLAWIYEKLHDWTDPQHKWTDDEISRFANDSVLLPRLWNQTLGPVIYEIEYEVGGHFAAWERPDAIANDLRVMFGKGGAAYACVTGKSGYEE